MKSADLYVLYRALVRKSKNLPFNTCHILKKTYDEKEIKAGQRRMELIGLLSGKNSALNVDRVRLFLTEALSFWWPAEKTQTGAGLALFSSSSGKVLGSQKNNVETFVWACDGESTAGEVIDPLWPELPKLASQDRELHEFFSLVEILRFPSHPLRTWAQKQMAQYLENIQKLGGQNYPATDQDFLELQDDEFETLVRFICSNGFRALTLQKAALLTRLPAHYLMEKWETDQALRLWIAAKYHEQSYEFLGPLVGQMQEMNKGHLALVLETFLDFVECHEDYYKMNLWAYLENDPSIQEVSRRGMRAFFETVLTLFKKSKPEAVDKAEFYSYLFTSTWKLYACFLWSDAKSLSPLIKLPRLKAELKGFVLRSVFEDY